MNSAMDFGALLDEWESRKKRALGGVEQVESLKARRASGDDGARCDSDDKAARIARAQELRRREPQQSIDLHGMTASQAEGALRSFLAAASARGLEKVLVIHGKGLHSAGDPVMEKTVRRVLESCAQAGAFGHAAKESGGRGATWVIVKRR